MITETGYSKDPSIMPEGIAITFGKEMMENNGGQIAMMKHFLRTMEAENDYWMHKMLRWPNVEVADVYIITLNRLWGKVKFGWYEKDATFAYMPDGSDKAISWPRMVLVGPFVRCPFKRELKGFQGFRYTTKLF
ncbi:MAG TPA: hypothetical protein VGQ59_15875 [Cyclobacteriaceae bacterium]|jgi:hypothetical protein|nr:hypothetical protein [Cyclobacteriaceae bacterium]